MWICDLASNVTWRTCANFQCINDEAITVCVAGSLSRTRHRRSFPWLTDAFVETSFHRFPTIWPDAESYKCTYLQTFLATGHGNRNAEMGAHHDGAHEPQLLCLRHARLRSGAPPAPSLSCPHRHDLTPGTEGQSKRKTALASLWKLGIWGIFKVLMFLFTIIFWKLLSSFQPLRTLCFFGLLPDDRFAYSQSNWGCCKAWLALGDVTSDLPWHPRCLLKEQWGVTGD